MNTNHFDEIQHLRRMVEMADSKIDQTGRRVYDKRAKKLRTPRRDDNPNDVIEVTSADLGFGG